MTEANTILRVMVDGAWAGADNMARDEAILEAVNAGESAGTLRFYRWEQPTISLGYFQKYEDVFSQDEAVRRLPVVRRQTGGGAILHDDELTYSLVLPAEHNGAASIEAMYQAAHDAFIAALSGFGVVATYRGGSSRGDNSEGNSQRGPFFCFARHHRLDVVAGGAKILGSAQRRIRGAVLQHGSLILDSHFSQQPCGTVAGTADKAFDETAFIRQAGGLIAAQLGLDVAERHLTAAETARLERLREKYRSDAWTRQR